MLRLKYPCLLIVAVLGAVGLFFGGPDLIHARSFDQAWDLGHIFIFSVWSFLLLHHWSWLKRLGFVKQSLVVLVCCVCLGTAIEWGQGFIGRCQSMDDVVLDGLGSLLALFFLFPKRLTLARPLRYLFQIVCLAALFSICKPVACSFVDELTAWWQFPVLSNFETPFERSRWRYGSMQINHTHVHSGNGSLRIKLSTRKYSGVALRYFPGNWQGWRHLTFSLYNPDTDPIRLTVKITDHHHDTTGHRHNDRFNRTLVIFPGWNAVDIDLDDVVSAPLNRQMDLSHITCFQLFSSSLPRPRSVYLDDLMLSP